MYEYDTDDEFDPVESARAIVARHALELGIHQRFRIVKDLSETALSLEKSFETLITEKDEVMRKFEALKQASERDPKIEHEPNFKSESRTLIQEMRALHERTDRFKVKLTRFRGFLLIILWQFEADDHPE